MVGAADATVTASRPSKRSLRSCSTAGMRGDPKDNGRLTDHLVKWLRPRSERRSPGRRALLGVIWRVMAGAHRHVLRLRRWTCRADGGWFDDFGLIWPGRSASWLPNAESGADNRATPGQGDVATMSVTHKPGEGEPHDLRRHQRDPAAGDRSGDLGPPDRIALSSGVQVLELPRPWMSARSFPVKRFGCTKARERWSS